jgi:MFS family permease
MALILGVWMLVDGGVYGVLVLFALHELGIGATGFGFLLTASAAGTVLGSMAAPRVARVLPAAYALAAALVVFGGAYVLIGTVPSVAVALLGFGVAGIGSGVWNVITVSFRQSHIPDHLFGRVSAAYRTLAWGGTSVGSLMGGVVATVFGLRAPLLVAGGTILLLSLLALVTLRETVLELRTEEDDAPPARGEPVAAGAPPHGEVLP